MSDPITSFERLYQRLDDVPPLTIAVPDADDETVLTALAAARERRWIEPVLVGDKTKLALMLTNMGLSPEDIQIVDQPEGQAAQTAVRLVRSGDADLLMKGRTTTADLLQAVLHPEHGLRRTEQVESAEGDQSLQSPPRILSHVAVVESPHYRRLMLFADGGVNIEQPLPVLRDILNNTLDLSRALNMRVPHVAVMALVENVTEKLPETRLARVLVKEATHGEFGNCVVEGPLALDMALSAEAAKRKGIDSRIAGQTDIFLGPNITAVNFVVKVLMSIGGARGGGMVLGAKAPIVLLSRADTPDTRQNSIALSMAAALYYSQHPSFGNSRQIGMGL
ncbi:MAG: phosphate acyltransferase [Candidatus Neomarinimicrobiota bacterium]